MRAPGRRGVPAFSIPERAFPQERRPDQAIRRRNIQET
jgi:hypothetical protein